MIVSAILVVAASLLGDLAGESGGGDPVPAAAQPVVVAAPAAEAGRSPRERRAGTDAPRSVKITSDRTDFDRKEGVIMFDGKVVVDDADYLMHADQLYVFLDTNELGRAGGKVEKKAGDRASSDMLRRIVALGNVSITNDTRVGTCARAVYTKASAKVVMYGDAERGIVAKLVDNGKRRSEVEGRKISFWIDTEQVEVEGSTVTLEGGLGGKDGAKKLLGK